MSDQFSLLLVSSGNRLRSPPVAALAERLTLDLPANDASTGSLELEGAPPLSRARTVGAGWGFDPAGYRTLPLTPTRVVAADLVLGFELHVRHAVVTGAVDQARAFILGGFVRLLVEQEIATAGGLELAGCRPSAPVGGQRVELSADPIRSPSPLRRRLVREDIPDGAPATDANEQARRDQLGEFVRGLGATDAGETLVLAPGQGRPRLRLECQKRSLLTLLQFGRSAHRLSFALATGFFEVDLAVSLLGFEPPGVR